MRGINVPGGVCLSYRIAYVLGVHFKSGEWGRKRCGSVVTTFYSGWLWHLMWSSPMWLLITNQHLLHRSVAILHSQEVHQGHKSRFFCNCRVVVRSPLPVLANTSGCKRRTFKCSKTTNYADHVTVDKDRPNPCPCGTSHRRHSLLHVTCARVGPLWSSLNCSRY